MRRKLKNRELVRKTLEEFKHAKKTPFYVVLDNVRSLNNVGSIFRTSDAFLIEGITLCGITACPPNKEIHRTALGATDSVNWKYIEKTEDAITELKKKACKVFAVEQTQNSINLDDFSIDLHEKYAFVFGNEVKGVAQKVVDMCDGSIEIPQIGTKHSLNISVSAGVVLWDLFAKYRKL